MNPVRVQAAAVSVGPVPAERRLADVAVIPLPAATAFSERFVAVCRPDHPFARAPTLDVFCAQRHLMVSPPDHPRGFVDETLEALGRRRRVALTVSTFPTAAALVAETDLFVTMPSQPAVVYAGRFGLVVLDLPRPIDANEIRVVATEAAMMNDGVA